MGEFWLGKGAKVVIQGDFDRFIGPVERFIVVLNFSGFDQWVDIPFSVNGPWQDLLNGWTSTVSNYRLSNERITSNWGRVYVRRD